jgi:hypothetical protein
MPGNSLALSRNLKLAALLIAAAPNASAAQVASSSALDPTNCLVVGGALAGVYCH